MEFLFWELCQEFHPNRLAGEKIPPGVIKLAEEKFQEIQSAYAAVGDIPALIPVSPDPALVRLVVLRNRFDA